MIPYMFQILGKDLAGYGSWISSALGWFTLGESSDAMKSGAYWENLIACGYQVPEILKRGLEITEKMLDEKEK